MSTLVQLVTRSIDMNQVIDLWDDEIPGEISLVFGPTHAAEVVTLQGADAVALREWLAAEHEKALNMELFGIPVRDLMKLEAPPILEDNELPF